MVRSRKGGLARSITKGAVHPPRGISSVVGSTIETGVLVTYMFMLRVTA